MWRFFVAIFHLFKLFIFFNVTKYLENTLSFLLFIMSCLLLISHIYYRSCKQQSWDFYHFLFFCKEMKDQVLWYLIKHQKTIIKKCQMLENSVERLQTLLSMEQPTCNCNLLNPIYDILRLAHLFRSKLFINCI